METGSALTALLAALLVVGRYRTSHLARDLALVHAYVVLAVVSLLPNVLPTMLATSGDSGLRLRLRLQLVGGLLAAASFAAAALVGDLRSRARQVPAAAAAWLGLVAPAFGILLLDALRVDSSSNLTVRSMSGVAGILFALAALGFARRPARSTAGDDERLRFRGQIAVACLFGAAARMAATFDPTGTAGDRLHAADVFRTGFYVVVLSGAVLEIREYWRRTAVLEERRRLARDLHDGLAQELSYIVSATARLPRTDEIGEIAASAIRALDESRRAISALTRPLDQPLADAIAEAAEDVTGRTGVPLRLELRSAVEVEPQVREELLRILREAVGNAARHAGAGAVSVVLADEPGLVRLRVIDDGCGFVTSAPTRRFGLTAMRERAAHIGAELSIASEPGTGTIVQLDLPVPTA